MAGSGRHQLTTPGRATRRVVLVALVLAWTIAAPAGVAAGVKLARGALVSAAGITGAPLAAERIDAGGVALAVRRVPDAGQGPHVAGEAALVAAVISDLESFWADTVPAISGDRFAPLRGGIVAVDSAAPSGRAPCVSSPGQIVGNAYYCPSDDGIVYDSSALVPVLLSRYGPPGLVGAFAHEFGHAVQARIGPTPEQRSADPARYPSLLIEAQGDCDAGAFLAWAVRGHAPHIHLDAAGMAAAVGPLLDFADPVTVPVTDPTAHGLSLDRLTSVLLGYRKGAAACHAMTVASLHPTLGEVPLPSGGESALATPRFASTTATLAAARRSIEAFEGAPGSGADEGGAGDVQPDPTALAAAAPYGQMAQSVTLALTVGAERAGSGRAAARRTAGTADTTGPTGTTGITDPTEAAASCFAGAWVASVFGHAGPGQLGSWPGDADEGLDAVRAQPGVTFAEIAAYADGFHEGLAACG